jgi:hypothetical protein
MGLASYPIVLFHLSGLPSSMALDGYRHSEAYSDYQVEVQANYG